jgi:hypothetical protein
MPGPEGTSFAHVRTPQLLFSIFQKEVEGRWPSQVPSINRWQRYLFLPQLVCITETLSHMWDFYLAKSVSFSHGDTPACLNASLYTITLRLGKKLTTVHVQETIFIKDNYDFSC